MQNSKELIDKIKSYNKFLNLATLDKADPKNTILTKTTQNLTIEETKTVTVKHVKATKEISEDNSSNIKQSNNS